MRRAPLVLTLTGGIRALAAPLVWLPAALFFIAAAIATSWRYRPHARTHRAILALRQLGKDLRAHRVAAGLFFALWLAIIGFSADAGMSNFTVLLTLLLSALAGLLIGHWRVRAHGGTPGVPAAVIAGAAIPLVSAAILLLVGAGGTPESFPSPWIALAEGIFWALLLTVPGLGAGYFGWMIGYLPYTDDESRTAAH